MGYKVYGPYLSKTENRRIAVLYTPEHRTTMSWARYLMCKKENRFLTSEEEVDHINDDKLDDRIENLQILPSKENKKKTPRPITAKHGTLSMLRHCKPACSDCRAFKKQYNNEYYAENRDAINKRRRERRANKKNLGQ